MSRAYSTDLRKRIIHHATTEPRATTARTFQVSPRTIRRLLERHRTGRPLEPGKTTGRKRRLTPQQETALGQQSDAFPDDTLAQHRQRLHATHGVLVSTATISRALTRLKRTRKKDGSRR
jgi:transposase